LVLISLATRTPWLQTATHWNTMQGMQEMAQPGKLQEMAQQAGIPGMMSQEDPRVSELQKQAWGLQSMCSKPGGKVPEAQKKSCYKLTSKALALCSDVCYTEEADFVERAERFKSQLEEKKRETEAVEEEEKAKFIGKCLRNKDGVYTVCDVGASKKSAAAAGYGGSLTSTDGARTLTASEIANRCAEDPECLSLCDMGLSDGDVETLCQGLKRAGAELTSLDVSHNLLADVGVQKLVAAFASGTCPKLEELHIGYNSFGDLGSQMLKGGLKTLRKKLVVHFEGSTLEAVC